MELSWYNVKKVQKHNITWLNVCHKYSQSHVSTTPSQKSDRRMFVNAPLSLWTSQVSFCSRTHFCHYYLCVYRNFIPLATEQVLLHFTTWLNMRHERSLVSYVLTLSGMSLFCRERGRKVSFRFFHLITVLSRARCRGEYKTQTRVEA